MLRPLAGVEVVVLSLSEYTWIVELSLSGTECTEELEETAVEDLSLSGTLEVEDLPYLSDEEPCVDKVIVEP